MAKSKVSAKPPRNAPVAVLDFETDPFLAGREPRPFAAGFYSIETGLILLWGDDAAAQLLAVIKGLSRPHVIYAHNGGRFDFFFIYPWLQNPLLIINSRIVEARLGAHWLRDSFAILPVPLASFEKRTIDYSKMERRVREKHKAEILEYLGVDCTSLFRLVSGFVGKFGFKITIGSAALSALQREHPQQFIHEPEKAEAHDVRFRPFYYGGRVQAFASGIVKAPFKVYDINSSYPNVMEKYTHPHGSNYLEVVNPQITRDGSLARFSKDRPFFIEFTGTATELPWKDKRGGLHFTEHTGTFTVPSHEFKVAHAAGLVKIHSIQRVLVPQGTQNFSAFVAFWNATKIEAEKAKDAAMRLFAKLLLNSAYGKFATNPRKFMEWHIETLGEWNRPEGDGWTVDTMTDDYRLWCKPVPTESGWRDVAIAASITSAARAELLKAILRAQGLAYVDTDSLICTRLSGMRMHATELGAWKTEAEGDRLAIGGKKLYALFNSALVGTKDKKGKINRNGVVKSASKGAVLNADDIYRVASGLVVEYVRDAPSYSVGGKAKFLRRNIRNTLAL
jgi:hypothetical protein